MRQLLMLAVLLVGCVPPTPPPAVQATSTQLQAARAFAAATLAMATEGGSPTPTPPGPGPGPEPEPNPGPSPVPPLPSETCSECNGTGRIKPDGRIDMECWTCGGDGKLTLPEMSQALRKRSADIKSLQECNENLIKAQQGQSREIKALQKKLEAKPKKVSVNVAPGVTEPVGSMVNWLTSGDKAKAEALRLGKPAFAFFTMDGCSPCARTEANCFSKASVAEYLNENFVAVKINKREMSKENIKEWEIAGFPSFRVIRSDWRSWEKCHFAPDEDVCLGELTKMLDWANEPTKEPAKPKTTKINYGRPVYDDSAIRMQRRVYYTEPSYDDGYYNGGYSNGGYSRGGGMFFGGGGSSCGPGGCN